MASVPCKTMACSSASLAPWFQPSLWLKYANGTNRQKNSSAAALAFMESRAHYSRGRYRLRIGRMNAGSHESFAEIKRRFKSAVQSILDHHSSSEIDEAALPAYAHKNP